MTTFHAALFLLALVTLVVGAIVLSDMLDPREENDHAAE